MASAAQAPRAPPHMGTMSTVPLNLGFLLQRGAQLQPDNLIIEKTEARPRRTVAQRRLRHRPFPHTPRPMWLVSGRGALLLWERGKCAPVGGVDGR